MLYKGELIGGIEYDGISLCLELNKILLWGLRELNSVARDIA